MTLQEEIDKLLLAVDLLMEELAKERLPIHDLIKKVEERLNACAYRSSVYFDVFEGNCRYQIRYGQPIQTSWGMGWGISINHAPWKVLDHHDQSVLAKVLPKLLIAFMAGVRQTDSPAKDISFTAPPGWGKVKKHWWSKAK